MPLRLLHAASAAPLLTEVLDPLIQRHIGFKLRDSFRVVVPDTESRQDLEDFFLRHEALEGILIGKSLLTLASFAQSILLRHPHPLPLASEPLQLTCLGAALKTVQPKWNLDLLQRRRCLKQLRQWERLQSLAGRSGTAQILLKEYEKLLATRGNAWSSKHQQEEAWKILGTSKSPDLEQVEDFLFLGFRLPEPALTGAIEALLRRYPKMRVLLLLPPETDLLAAEGKFEPWLRQVQTWAGTEVEHRSLPLPSLELQSFPTPLHEMGHRIQAWSQDPEAIKILAPTSVFSNVAAQLQPLLGTSGPAPTLQTADSQVSSRLLATLSSELETERTFSELIERFRPGIAEMQSEVVQNRDFDSLRMLEAHQQRFLSWAQAQASYPERLPAGEWIEILRQDFSEIRSAAAPASLYYPLRRLGQSGLAASDTLFILGLNEGTFPSKPTPEFFGEASLRFLELQEERLAFRQALYLGQSRVSLSYSHFSISGRTAAPSPFLAELKDISMQAREETLPLPAPRCQLYFEENIQREHARHFGEVLGLDSGNLSALHLKTAFMSRFSEHALSATYLDEYAKCPWRFFAKWHLRLREEPEEDLEVHAKRRGQWLHRLLEDTFKAMASAFFAAGKIPSLSEMQEHFETAFTALSTELLAMDLPVPLSLRRDQLRRLRQNILELLECEQKEWNEAPQPLLPRHTEWSFGGRHSPHFFELDAQHAIPLTGKIDRIDVSKDGRHFLLIDYKSSGSGDLAKNIREGRSLQLWIYFQATGQILYPQSEGVGGLYWDLKKLKQDQGMARRELIQNYRHKKISGNAASFMKEETFEALQTKIESILRDLLIKILAGDYGLNPADCQGPRCEFREICRYDDQPR